MTNSPANRDHDETPREVERPVVRSMYFDADLERPRITLIQTANILLRYRRLIVVLPLVFGTVAVVKSLLSRRTYTATASFTPQTGSRQQSPLAGLAAQFGVGTPGSAASPQFYEQIAKSRIVRRRIAEMPFTYRTGNGPRTATVADIWDVKAPTEPERLELAADQLGSIIRATTEPRTSIVTVSATTAWPELSEQLVSRTIRQVDLFNTSARQAQAAGEAQFVADRVRETQDSLRMAEEQLKGFLMRNRGGLDQSPDLAFQRERLQREVVMRQQLFSQLTLAFEQARIDAVRDLPVITAIERAEGSARANARHSARKGFVGMVLGLGLALLFALGRTLLQSSHVADDDRREFRRLRAAALADVWRVLPVHRK